MAIEPVTSPSILQSLKSMQINHYNYHLVELVSVQKKYNISILEASTFIEIQSNSAVYAVNDTVFIDLFHICHQFLKIFL